eukprot:TRINITY_DN46125_c0_g1_i1.p1 TRINITY_DN46125_c0_g1~~TRINITY_DN46125_c0_g1_i1.p1  ORF type:complete len:152 (+),score=37.01 TRINITY_DN46125_c0_g1_i1:60-458(+)
MSSDRIHEITTDAVRELKELKDIGGPGPLERTNSDMSTASADEDDCSKGRKMTQLLLSPLSTCSTAPPNTPLMSGLLKSSSLFGSQDFSWLEDEDDDEIMLGKPLWKLSSQHTGDTVKDMGQGSNEEPNTCK